MPIWIYENLMTTIEIVLFVILFLWLGAVVARADKLIKDIHNRLDDIEEKLGK